MSMPPYVPDVFDDMYCNMSRSSTTEDLISGMLVDDDTLCTHGGMHVAIYVYRGCHHPIAFLIIRFSGILNRASLVLA